MVCFFENKIQMNSLVSRNYLLVTTYVQSMICFLIVNAFYEMKFDFSS